MRRFVWLAPMLMAACPEAPDTTTTPEPRNGLVILFDVDLSELEDDDGDDGDHEREERLDTLSLEVSRVEFRASGPEGDVTIALSTPAELGLFGTSARDAPPVLDLPAGTYEDAEVIVTLGWLHATGRVSDLDWTMDVPEPVELEADTDAFELGIGPDSAVRFELRPDKWMEPLDPDELTGPVLVAPDSLPEAYENLIEELEHTDGRFPGDSGDDDDER